MIVKIKSPDVVLDTRQEKMMIVLTKDSDPFHYVADPTIAEAIREGRYECNKGDLMFIECANCNADEEVQDLIEHKDTKAGLEVRRTLKALGLELHQNWFNSPYYIGRGSTIFLKILVNLHIHNKNLYVNNYGLSLHPILKVKALRLLVIITSRLNQGMIVALDGNFSNLIYEGTHIQTMSYKFNKETRSIKFDELANLRLDPFYEVNVVIVEKIDGEIHYDWY